MKAIAIVPGKKGTKVVNRKEPRIRSPHDVKLRVLQVGICGTDREQAGGGRALLPKGQKNLVIGHEMLGQVIDAGKEAKRFRAGDYAVFTVRRGCGIDISCGMNRSDMCRTGKYRERGIWGLDGFQAEIVVDHEQYLVRVPQRLSHIAVLTEPLSVAEKAIDEAVRLQFARLPDAPASLHWLYGRRCLVAGLGPVGLLAAMALRLRGAEVFGFDIVDPNTTRPKWFAVIGGHYIDARKIPADKVDEEIGPMDLIFEATGVPEVAFNLIDALAYNGVYALTGIPGGERQHAISGAKLMRELVLQNQVVVGSVNAARDHFIMAVDDLAHAHVRWGDHIDQLITHRYGLENFSTALNEHPADEIKAVVEWRKP